MSQVNKQSLREESERIKAEFERISSSNKLSDEINLLFRSMLMMNQLLVSIYLEKTTPKHSKNSSIPPSQTSKDETQSIEKSNSKGKQDNGQLASNTRTVEIVTIVPVKNCDKCGADLSQVACEHVERRTMIDIVFEKVVKHVDLEVKGCPECLSTVKAKPPLGMESRLQYGNGLKAKVIDQLVTQMLSLDRTQKQIRSMIGETISQTTFLNFIDRLNDALLPWETEAKETILNAKAINTDETGLRVDKKNEWIHSYSAGDITLKFLHSKRGLEAMEEIGLLPRYKGVIIHDCWASYFNYDQCQHALCGSHLVRELTAAIESNGYRFATNMKELLLEACNTVSERHNKKLTKKEYKTLQRRYRNILTRAESELPQIPDKPNGRRGKIAKSDAHNLCERLRQHESAVLLFAKHSYVPFTNNRAERDLRMTKVKQKVSGCFRKQHYAKAYCRISSYLQTMANKGFNSLVAIQMALDGDIP